MAVSRAQLVKELLPALDSLFGKEYARYMRPQYKVKFLYGKYAIYKTERNKDGAITTTLAKGLSRLEADGMMKLLKEDEDE